MFHKIELIEVLCKELTILCPEIYEAYFKRMINLTVFETVDEYSKRGHMIEYIGGGLFMFKL